VAERLLEESYLSRYGEEVVKRAMAEVDYFGDEAVGDQLIEKSNLTMYIPDVDDGRYLWQIIYQLRTFIGQVECYHVPVIDEIKLSEQPRH
jgi:hypothetical protein